MAALMIILSMVSPCRRCVYCAGNYINQQAENTLRLLFSGQKQQTTSTCSFEEPTLDSSSESEMPNTEALDPRQQTLHRFFFPAKSPSSTELEDVKRQTSAAISSLGRIQSKFLDGGVSVGSSAISGSTTPFSENMQTNALVDVEIGRGLHRDVSSGMKGVDEIGWM